MAPHRTLDDLVRGWRGWALLALLAAGSVALAGTAVAQKSVTVDEFQALPHGLAIWKTGDFHLATGVPVLPSLLPALPLLASSARFDPQPMAGYVSSWQCGDQFLRENLESYHPLFLQGRMISLAVLLVTCLLTYALARRMYGATGGLLAAVFACLSPNLLAHGALVTPDIYLAAAIVAALFAFDLLFNRPGWPAAVALGCALGLASLSKLTGLLLFAIFPALLACFHFADRAAWRRAGQPGKSAPPALANLDWSKRWLAAALAMATGLVLIHVGYLFDGSFSRLDQFQFESTGMATVAEMLPGWLRVPLPYPFFKGIDAQLAEEGYVAYLNGEFNETGFFHYYLVGLLVKTPLCVPVLAVVAWWGRRGLTRSEVALVATGGLLLLFFSLSKHKNIGLRYVLFLEPLLAIWIGRLGTRIAMLELPGTQTAAMARDKTARRAAIRLTAAKRDLALAAAAAGWMLFTAVSAWPHYLAYFNRASGGPTSGHKYLLDSNLDWGQDLIELRRFMEREGIDSIDLAYFGRVPPEVYGVSYRMLGAGPPARYAAISANLLWGRMYFVNGTSYWPEDKDTYAAYRRLKPKAVLGHSIYVFELAP